MFRRHDPLHPFSHYKIGKVETYGGNHYLRMYSYVLWVMSEHEPHKCVRRVYYNGKLNEYEMEAEEISKFKKRVELNKELQIMREDKLLRIKAPLVGARPVDFDQDDTITVLQCEYAIAHADSPKPVVGTFGAGSCLILALYDSKNKMAAVSHISALTEINSLSRIFYHLSLENTVAHLVGGNTSSKDMCLDIFELLERKNISIINTDIAKSSYNGSSLAIDARNGHIYSPVNPSQLSTRHDFEMHARILAATIYRTRTLQEVKAEKINTARLSKNTTSDEHGDYQVVSRRSRK